jgi:hypothetical protein
MTRPLNRAAFNGFLGGSEGRTKKLNMRALIRANADRRETFCVIPRIRVYRVKIDRPCHHFCQKVSKSKKLTRSLSSKSSAYCCQQDFSVNALGPTCKHCYPPIPPLVMPLYYLFASPLPPKQLWKQDTSCRRLCTNVTIGRTMCGPCETWQLSNLTEATH